MIKNIVKDTLFLSQKAIPATKEDKYIAQELIDTLLANQYGCVGMAANMIGYNKSVIVFSTGFMPIIMFNPIITKKNKKYNTKECTKRCIRYSEMDYLMYLSNIPKPRQQPFSLQPQKERYKIRHSGKIFYRGACRCTRTY